ncbi:MAG: glycosyl hydrolase-related protein, partial [Planctomycetaceae bacterium]|nr:glycosyl hydrolase-related protein [Planctomycetaceae bacterium]
IEKETTYELVIDGTAHYGTPPKFTVSLNGNSQELQTRPNCIDDAAITAGAGESFPYTVSFAADLFREKGNTITITTTEGAWFIYDRIRLKVKGYITGLTLTPQQGILRGDSGALKKIHLDYQDEPLTKNATLKYVAGSSETQINLTPHEHKDGIDILLPVTDLKKVILFKAVLTIDDRTITAETEILPSRLWEVHLIHQTHLDIGYTHVQTDILKRQVQSLRDTLRYIDETKNYPEEAKFRFHPEGMWAVDQFLKEATDEEKAAFVKAAKNRDLHIDGMYAQAMTGMYNDEELFELFGNAARFCHENGIVLDSVMQSDIPGYTWGLVTAMAQNGIKYMSMAPNCEGRVGRVYMMGDKPFWWVSPNGKEKILCWLLDTGYHQFWDKQIGHLITETEIFRLLSGSNGSYVNNWGERVHKIENKTLTYLFDDLVVVRYAIDGDNGRPNRALSDAVKAWNEKYLYPKLIISRNSDVMKLLEERYGNQLPVVRGDFTPYWEDGSASTTEATAINRRAKERLIQAETLWALFNPKNYPSQKFDEAWTDLIMYDEHTWGAYNSISEPDSDFVKTQDNYKQEFARRGSQETNALVKLATKSNPDTKKTLLVNTLSRKRDGICFIGKAVKDFEGNKTLRIFRTKDGKHVPVQYIADPNGKNTCSMYADLSLSQGVSAPNIPALGFIEVEPDTTASINIKSSLNVNSETGEINNNRIKLSIDKESGTIKSLKILSNPHEFVDSGSDGNRGLNDYLYIIGRNAAENRERINQPQAVRFTVLAAGPLVASVLVEINNGVPNVTSLKQQITVFEDSEQIRIENVLDKKMERKPEGTFFGFPFNIPDGKWFIDTAWALTEVEKDQLPGANRNYFCVQRYCTLANDHCGVHWVTVDANMIQFAPIVFTGYGELNSWRKNFEDGQPGGTFYSWVCNNHWETNYKAGQDGQLTFEYWILPYVNASFDNGVAQHFARQIHQPVLQLNTEGNANNPVTNSKLLKLENENNILTTRVKPSRDDNGALVVRLFNPTRQVQETKIIPSTPYKTVYRSNPLEEKFESLEKLELNPMETITVRIE